MNKNGTLIYKCRRCEKIVRNTEVPDIDGSVVLISKGKKLPEDWCGDEGLTSFHTCNDGNMGITDCIGGEIMKEKNPKIFEKAIAKIHIYDRSQDQWYGILTPSEILELVKNGAKPHKGGYPYSQPSTDRVKKLYDNGDSGPIIFYFFASKLPIPNYKREIEKAYGRSKKNG